MAWEKLKNGFMIRPKLSGDPEYAAYVQDMAKSLRAAHPNAYNRPKPTKPDGMTTEQWIMSMQAQSTQVLLEKHKDPDYKRDWSAPLPDNVLANPKADSLDELTNKRDLSLDEIKNYHFPGKYNTLGQSSKSAFEDTKDKAKHAFMVTPPALLSETEMKSVAVLTPPVEGVPTTMPAEEWKPMSTWEAIKHKIKGNKVKLNK